MEVGGTSASTPIWAAMIAVVNQGRMANGMNSLASVQADVYSILNRIFTTHQRFNSYNLPRATIT